MGQSFCIYFGIILGGGGRGGWGDEQSVIFKLPDYIFLKRNQTKYRHSSFVIHLATNMPNSEKILLDLIPKICASNDHES